jgi:hypothetical protein
MGDHCGLANPQAACRCERQLPAARHVASARGPDRSAVVAIHREEMQEAERHFAAFTRVCDAASVLRGHPAYQAPESMRAAIRAVLAQEGFLQRGAPQ